MSEYSLALHLHSFRSVAIMMGRKSNKELRERHLKILTFVRDFHAENGYPPSIREIGEQTGISSTSVVNYYLDQLEEEGYIKRDRKISRGVVVTDKIAKAFNTAVEVVGQMLRIPIGGQIVAGSPVPVPGTDFSYFDAEANVEIARSLLPVRDTRELFALRVQGDSMIDAMVNDGDIVILQPVTQVKNGEMVAVWLPEKEETTLKFFYKEKDGYRLQPANPLMDPIILNKNTQIELKGRVVMVVRQVERAL
jgi:repressor LexA